MSLGPLPSPLLGRLRSWSLLGFGCSTAAIALVGAGGFWDRSEPDNAGAPRVVLALASAVAPASCDLPSDAATALVDPPRPAPEDREQATASADAAGQGPGPVPPSTSPAETEDPSSAEAIERARAMVAECREVYAGVRDYRCVFYKRERLASGRTTPLAIMQMKARTSPRSIYFKFLKPNAGREAIWVADQNDGKIVVHDVGLGKLLAGTLHLDPQSRMAMADSRHPISDAGLGHLLATVSERWQVELKPGESQIQFHHDVQVGDRDCTMIESTHTERDPEFHFHKVKLYIDRELKLPIRFEAYDWPETADAEPPLAEEYTYQELELNPGLSADEFDPGNEAYAFGRF